jgi:hypothetical protein
MPILRKIKRAAMPTHKPTLRKTKRAIFCQRTDNDIEHLKLNLADRNNIKY